MKQARKGYDEVTSLLYRAMYGNYKLTHKDYSKIIDYIVKGEYCNDIQRVDRETTKRKK